MSWRAGAAELVSRRVSQRDKSKRAVSLKGKAEVGCSSRRGRAPGPMRVQLTDASAEGCAASGAIDQTGVLTNEIGRFPGHPLME